MSHLQCKVLERVRQLGRKSDLSGVRQCHLVKSDKLVVFLTQVMLNSNLCGLLWGQLLKTSFHDGNNYLKDDLR